MIHAVRLRGAGQNRAVVAGPRIVLADGAGGTARGAAAGDRAVALLAESADFDAVDAALAR